jgi:signal transduction histidine kinase
MTSGAVFGIDTLLATYVLAFGAAAVACFVTLRSANRIEDADTRRGLRVLLALSGGWALSHVGLLLASSRDVAYAFYTVGLIIGLTTTLPWLYFCSAYTGRSLHRNATYRRILGGVFLFIILLKLTNPFHGLYFTAGFTSVPFLHLAVEPGVIHWVVLGFSYMLAAIGYFMLFELFTKVGHDTKPLVGLAGLAGFPVLLDIAATLVPELIEINYEPLGVAAFGVGVLYLYLEDFRTVQLAGESDDLVIVLDNDKRLRDYNVSARELFPELVGSIGDPIRDVLPEVADRLTDEEAIIEVNRVGGMRYYGVTESPFTANHTNTGTLVSFTDVTHREEYRRELERQNERLENFAGMVSHDLRNPLTVAKGNIDLARRERDDEELETAVSALDRMEALIEDLLDLARQGQPIEEPEPVDLAETAGECWRMVEASDASLAVADDFEFSADPDRLQQLLENLFRNAVEHGASDVTVTLGALEDGSGFYVEDDGPGIPEEDRDQMFESGFTTNQDGTGFGLAIVREIAEAHGWNIRTTEAESGGARFEITGVERPG